MINISKLYCGTPSESDALRYGEASSASAPSAKLRAGPRSAAERRPVVVWNVTRTCNLRCLHCYSDSDAKAYEGELSTGEAKALLQDLAQFKVPAVLFSGGEPLGRRDLFELASYAKALGLRPTLSTNGVLIDEGTALRIKEAGFTYVGISLDGIGPTNDQFRGVKGAFEKALRGFRILRAVGQRVGLRMTLTRHNYENLPQIFDLIKEEEIDRACFYHLVPSGRGRRIASEDLSHEETRYALDMILEKVETLQRIGRRTEILTVDNHVDGVYLYLKLKERDPKRASQVFQLLQWNGGGLFSSGVGIADVDWFGDVHPDQFWIHYTLGNIKRRPFSEIWQDTCDPLMAGLKDRKPRLKGRCSTCQWLDLCGGSLRVRADLLSGDPFAPDPACYLSDEEIGFKEQDQVTLEKRGENLPR